MENASVTLTKDQIEFFHREGFLAIDELTDQKDVAFLREVYDHIFTEQAGRELGDQFDLAGTDEDGKVASLPQILNPARYAPEIENSQLFINATVVVKQLLSEKVVCRFAHAIFKPARIGAETPWHQDAAYWSPDMTYRSISIWVPLQEVTEENGCMQFVPHSHEWDVVTHQSINNDPRIHGLELTLEEMKRVKNVVSCPLPAGGATFHGAYMMHYTAPNCSNVPRRALILNAGNPNITRTKPRKFPWMEEKNTARDKRAKSAADAGIEVSAPPTGNAS